jgi:hypothetical protein
VWPCIVEGVVLDFFCFTSESAGRIVVVGPALTMVTAVSSGMINASLLVGRRLITWSRLVFLLHHGCVYFCGELIRWREIITINAIIAFTNREAK